MASKRKLEPAKSTFEHRVKQKRIDDRVKQLEKAIQYCKEINCKEIGVTMKLPCQKRSRFSEYQMCTEVTVRFPLQTKNAHK